MRIQRILLDENFSKEFLKLPLRIQRRAERARVLLLENAFHPSLRVHKLSGPLDGLWSVSVNRHYRILFEPLEGGDVVFVSIGTHAVYE